MSRFFQGSEASIVRYIRHVLHNGSFYPLTTFWLLACGVIMATWMDLLSHTHAVVAMGFAALILLLIADKRDQREANESFEVQLEAVRDLISRSAALASAVATIRSDNQERSMHAQDLSIAHLTDTTTDKDPA